MSKILTVVVPTYNVEKYIRQNLESFEVEQVLEDLEVLIVSVGSKDGSVDIAREFARCWHIVIKSKRLQF